MPNKDSNNNSNFTFGERLVFFVFFGILTLMLISIILKLCDIIHWDWEYILAPIWLPIISFALIIIASE